MNNKAKLAFDSSFREVKEEDEDEFDFSSEEVEDKGLSKNVIILQNMKNNQEIEVKKNQKFRKNSEILKSESNESNWRMSPMVLRDMKAQGIISKDKAKQTVIEFQNIKSPNTIKENFQGGRRKSIDFDNYEHKEHLGEQSFISE